MSFQTQPGSRFANIFAKSDYHAQDPLIKANYIARGNNLIFGRSSKEDLHSNLIYLGKVIENTVGKNYLNADCWLDTRFPHVIYITGTRGSGKSFDLGVLLEGISELIEPSPIQEQVLPIASILIDTQSQFWTLGYKPIAAVAENKVQLQELARWNIKPNNLSDIQLWIPAGTSCITGREQVFSLRPYELKQEEWCTLLGEEVYSPQGHIIAHTIESMPSPTYTLQDMLRFIAADINWPTAAVSSRNAVQYKLDNYRRAGVFEGGTPLDVQGILRPGRCNVFMVRDLRNEDKSLVASIIARQLFTKMGDYHKRLKVSRFFETEMAGPELPSKVWLLIDEAHVIAPTGQPAPARAALLEYVKRGRDAGLSLGLATQQPSAVDDGILSQVNITFSHRLSFQQDIQAACNRIPTKVMSNLRYGGIDVAEFGDMIRYLDAGQCFIGDHNTSRTVMVQIRPRVTSHGGYSPV